VRDRGLAHLARREAIAQEIRSVAAVLASYGWHDQAACAGWETEVFFPDRSGSFSPGDEQGAGPRLLPLLVCSMCPVRRECLEQGLQTWAYGEHPGTSQTMFAKAVGVWGGTLDEDRSAVRRLPADEAADLLERTFPERLARRLEAYLAKRRVRRFPSRSTPFDQRIDELLNKRETEEEAQVV
jgi:hypothetical protein